jgi:hypothetical protein
LHFFHEFNTPVLMNQRSVRYCNNENPVHRWGFFAFYDLSPNKGSTLGERNEYFRTVGAGSRPVTPPTKVGATLPLLLP